MKKWLDPDFLLPFLIFCVIQPGIFFFAISIFVWAIFHGGNL